MGRGRTKACRVAVGGDLIPKHAAQVGIAIVGLGWGERKCQIVSENPDTHLVCVIDRDESRARRVAARFGVEWSTRVEDALGNPAVDAIGVYTPSGSHSTIIEQAAKAGKHVFCTKPLEISVDRIDRIVDVGRHAGIVIAVDHERRYRPLFQRLRTAIGDGRFGRMVLSNFAFKAYRAAEYYDYDGGWRGTWDLNGGGVMMNQMIHLFDLAYWFFGPPTGVCAMTRTLGHAIDVEDTAVSIVSFANGSLSSITGTTCYCTGDVSDDPSHRSIPSGAIEYLDVSGTTAAIVIESGEVKHWSTLCGASDEWLTADNDVPDNIVSDLVRCVVLGTRPLVDPIEARASVKIAEAMYESSRTGQPVQM